MNTQVANSNECEKVPDFKFKLHIVISCKNLTTLV